MSQAMMGSALGFTTTIKGVISGVNVSVTIPHSSFKSFRPSSGPSLSYATGGVLSSGATTGLIPEFAVGIRPSVVMTTAVVSVGSKQFILSMTASDGGGAAPPNSGTPPDDGEPANGEKEGTLEISAEGLITKDKEPHKFVRLLHTGKELAKRGYNVKICGEAEGMAAEITLKPGNGIEQLAPAESKLLDSPRANAVQSNLRYSRTQKNGSFVIIDGTASG